MIKVILSGRMFIISKNARKEQCLNNMGNQKNCFDKYLFPNHYLFFVETK